MSAAEHDHLPDANRLSIVAALVVLTYALTPFLAVPGQRLSLALFGIRFDLPLGYGTALSALAAVLAGAGASWLISMHPHLYHSQRLRHVFIPALTAWVIGVPLSTLEVGAPWWGVLALGGILLVLVLVAEYIAVEPDDVRHAPAAVGLTAVSFALYLILAIALRAAQFRLYMLVPALTLALFAVAVRSLYLHLGGVWRFAWAIGIALFVGQLALGLYYTGTPPLRFGLILLGPAYALTSLAGALSEGRPLRMALGEPVTMLAVFWLLAALFNQ
ncbi:MAG TPA: hypothetical protein PKG95_04690 [Anaerolineaceae bacterium]|jgi:hypothetical protein|nr:hypothetical protein [Anaerolineaceae bacterium]